VSGFLKTKRIFLVFCLFASLVANDLKFGSIFAQESGIDYKLAKEINFDKPVSKVIFATAEKDGKEFLYPKTIVFNDEVQFWDKEGKVVASVPVDGEVHTSKQGKFIGIEKSVIPKEVQEKYPDDAYKWAMKYLTVYNDQGKEVWHSKEPIAGAEETYSILISGNDGSGIVPRLDYGGIDFYNSNGERRTVEPFGRVGWASRGGCDDLSQDGEYYAIIAEELPLIRYKNLPGKSTNPWLILYQKNGDELWRKPLKEYIGDEVLISSTGNYILGYGHTMAGVGKGIASKELFLYNKEGKLIFTNAMVFQVAGFSPEESYVSIADGNKVLLMESNSGKIVLDKQLPNEVEAKNKIRESETRTGERAVQEEIMPYRISGSFVSSEGENVLVRVYKTYQRPADIEIKTRAEAIAHYDQYMKQSGHSEIFLLDRKGDIIWQKFCPPGDPIPIPIAISADSRQIALLTNNNRIEIIESKF
jgi:hypothetical protein